MNRIEIFRLWLKENTSLSHSTIQKYSNAIKTISNELVEKELLIGTLYNITDPVILEKYFHTYLSIPEFNDKDTRGNRMYSNALKYYKLFSEKTEWKK